MSRDLTKTTKTKVKPTSKWTASDISFVVIGSIVLLVGAFVATNWMWQVAPKLDPEKAMVEQWLKENLDDGRWEEVKWHSAVPLHGVYDANLLHIVEGIERTKLNYERGRGKEDHKEECQKAYDKLRETGVRTVCAMKFRVSTLNGQGRALRQQAFEIVGGNAVALPHNFLREIPLELSDGSYRQQLFEYDVWRLFDDRDYDPFHPELLKNVEARLQDAMVWKAPSEIPAPVVAAPPPQVQARPKTDVVINLPMPNQKPSEEVKPTIPTKIREYFTQVTEARGAEISKLEKRLSGFETRRRSAKGMTEVKAVEDRIKQTEDAIAELKRSNLRTYSAPLRNKPDVGDFGAFQSVEVTQVVDQETLVVKWHPNGKGQLPKVDVVIYPIDTTEVKVGEAPANADFVKVTATKDDPAAVLERLNDAGTKADFVVRPTDKKELESWYEQFEKEHKPKK